MTSILDIRLFPAASADAANVRLHDYALRCLTPAAP
jgi:hypothetical protein